MQFPTYINNLIKLTESLLEDNPDLEIYVEEILRFYAVDIEDWLNSSIMPMINDIIKSVSMSLISLAKALYNLIIGFIISVYVLGNKERFASQAKKIAYAFMERKTANHTIRVFRFINRTFIGFFGGKIIDSAIIGMICFVGTSIMNTPYALLISVIVGVTNIIPFFGPFIGAIPCTILILFAEPIQALYFVIFILILQQVDGNIIGPKILGDSTGLSSFWVIFSITLFGGLFGLLGMIIGVPVFAVLFAFIKSSAETKLAQKGLPTETSTYMKLLYIHPEDYRVENFSEEDKKPSSYITNFLVRNKRQKSRKDTKSKTNTKITDEYDGE